MEFMELGVVINEVQELYKKRGFFDEEKESTFKLNISAKVLANDGQLPSIVVNWVVDMFDDVLDNRVFRIDVESSVPILKIESVDVDYLVIENFIDESLMFLEVQMQKHFNQFAKFPFNSKHEAAARVVEMLVNSDYYN